MSLLRWVVVAAYGTSAVTVAVTALVGQSGPGRNGPVAPRMMVANPYSPITADSVPAVEIGNALRQSVQEMVGDDYMVVTQQQMNDALVQYGWTPDAILNPSLSLLLAKNIQARIVLTSNLAKNQDGLYTLTSRLAGVSDEAGNVMIVAQHPDERFLDYGYRVAEELRPAVKSLADAKMCMDEVETKPDHAAKMAEKAIKKLPNHGLAHFCLYTLGQKQKQPAAAGVKELEVVVKGDPFSVPAWSLLARAYQDANDTANTLAAAKQLLRLAPNDQDLRTRLFKYMLQTNQTKSALDIADEGLKLDGNNAGLYDLKANACFALKDLECAAEALDKVYAIDSTKADTLYFLKWAAIALAKAPASIDTTRLLTWSEIGARKFPNNLTILYNLYRAYMMTGAVDSSLALSRRLIERDTTAEAVLPALTAVRELAKAQRLNDAAPFADFIKRHGDATQKTQLAQMIVRVALIRFQGDSTSGVAADPSGAVQLAQSAIEFADTTSEPYQQANFVVGAVAFLQATELDSVAVKEQSCDSSRKVQQLMNDAKLAFGKVQVEKFKESSGKYLNYIDQFDPHIRSILKTYCR